MKIGVISDTHLGAYDERLARIVNDHFRDVEMIFHAGDLVELDVLDAFVGKEVYAVCGNMDSASVKRTLPRKRVFEIGEHRIGLIHGWGDPMSIEKKIVHEFENIDCLVYGHTHRVANRLIGDVLFFNPGSPTDRRFSKENSIGILEIDHEITGTIIPLTGY